MKKILAIAVSLVLVLCAAAACAEKRGYVEAGTMDADGNVTAIADLTDPRVIAFDDEDMTCAYGTKDTVVEGTCEVTEKTDDAVTIVATFENEEPVTFTYEPTEDVFLYTDANDGTIYVFTKVDTSEEALKDRDVSFSMGDANTIMSFVLNIFKVVALF